MTGDHRPFDPPRAHPGHLRRLRHTYHGYGGGLRGALAAWGYLGGRINGTLRINRAGNRWLNLRGPGLQHPARRHLADILAGAVIAAPFVVGLTMVDDPASARVGKGLIAVFAAGISLVLILQCRHELRKRRLGRPPPPPPRCVHASNLAAAPGADRDQPLQVLAMARELEPWLDAHDLTLRATAAPDKARAYRWALHMRTVGHTLVPFNPDPVEVLERQPRNPPQLTATSLAQARWAET